MGPSLSWGYSFSADWGVSFGGGTEPSGGGGSASKGKSKRILDPKIRKGWVRERAIFEASQLRNKVKTTEQIEGVFTQPEVSYSGELEKLNNLKAEFAKLQNAYNLKQEQAKDLNDASIALNEFLSDEEESIYVLIATQEYEARQMLEALGLTASTQPTFG